jgi:uncharacterized protein YjhX (UPF0386 family)
LNVSKQEQRVLHALAQGGHIAYRKDDRGKIIEVLCLNRDGCVLSDCTLAIFRKLKRRGLVASHDSRPYRITRDGLAAVRPQLDNR